MELKVGRPCHTCRLRHVLCDRQRPCGRCVRLGETHQCVDPPRLHKLGRPRKQPQPPPGVPPLPLPSLVQTAASTYVPPGRPVSATVTIPPDDLVAARPPSLLAPTTGRLPVASHAHEREGQGSAEEEEVLVGFGSVDRSAPQQERRGLAVLMELRKVRRECVTMKSKLDRLAKRQKATNARINSLPLLSDSPHPPPSTSSSSSPSSSGDTLSRRSPSVETEWLPMSLNWLDEYSRSCKFNFQRVVPTRPSGLLSSLGCGRPWLIQRAVSPAEISLPKHHLPPDMDAGAFAARGGLTLLVTNFDDGFCSLLKAPREELEDINIMWLFSQAMRADVIRLAGEIYQRRPTRDGPVFVFTAGMLDRTGAQLQVMGRWQAFYNEEGEYSWCVVIIDRWVVLGREIPLWPVPPPQLPSTHQHQHQHQHPPDLPLFELVATDWV